MQQHKRDTGDPGGGGGGGQIMPTIQLRLNIFWGCCYSTEKCCGLLKKPQPLIFWPHEIAKNWNQEGSFGLTLLSLVSLHRIQFIFVFFFVILIALFVLQKQRKVPFSLLPQPQNLLGVMAYFTLGSERIVPSLVGAENEKKQSH